MAASQTRQAVWMVVGWVVLLPFCVGRCWEMTTSTINPDGRVPRPVSRWKTRWAWVTEWLNAVYGNREDGVSGEEALIWVPGESVYGKADRVEVRVYYRPWSWYWVRAWCWSAWRNSTNELSR